MFWQSKVFVLFIFFLHHYFSLSLTHIHTHNLSLYIHTLTYTLPLFLSLFLSLHTHKHTHTLYTFLQTCSYFPRIGEHFRFFGVYRWLSHSLLTIKQNGWWCASHKFTLFCVRKKKVCVCVCVCVRVRVRECVCVWILSVCFPWKKGNMLT